MKRLLLLALCLFLLFTGCAKKSTSIQAPYFEVKGIDGKTYTINMYKGKRLLLVFWATWCPTCKKELKKLSEEADTLKRAHVNVLLVAMDRDRDAVARTAKEHGFNIFPVAVASQQMLMDYPGVRFLPTAFLIDEKGFIVKKFVGEIPLKEVIGQKP